MSRLALVLVLLLLAPSAWAQDVGAFAKRTAMLAVGMGVSIGTASAAADSDEAVLFLIAPLTSALGIYGMGRVLGADGDFGGTMRGAALGAVPGLVIGLVGFTQLNDASCVDNVLCGDGAGLLVVGALLYLAGPPIGALIGFGSVEPITKRETLTPGFDHPTQTIGLRMTF